MLERKEEVHELTLLQLHPEVKSVSEDEEETTILRGDCDDDAHEDMESERGDSSLSGGTSDECLGPGSTDQVLGRSEEGEATDMEQLDNEIAMLIYRNGLVFDVKTESPWSGFDRCTAQNCTNNLWQENEANVEARMATRGWLQNRLNTHKASC